MLGEDDFQLFGVATRFPRNLAGQVEMKPLKQGVYEVLRGTDRIRIIVLSEVPRENRNVIWHLFSGLPEMVRYGASQYKKRAEDMSTIINKLFEKYNLEGLKMPYTMEDFRKEIAIEHLNTLTIDEILQHKSADEILQHMSTDDLLRGFLNKSPRLKGLSINEIKAYLNRIVEKKR